MRLRVREYTSLGANTRILLGTLDRSRHQKYPLIYAMTCAGDIAVPPGATTHDRTGDGYRECAFNYLSRKLPRLADQE